MMKTGTLRLALAAAMLTLGTTAATAEKAPAPARNAVEVRVINNYLSPVRVYVRDAKGRTHDMGWIGRADLKIMQVSKDIAELGAFEIRVFPDEPVWSRLNSDNGVRTKGLTVPEGKALNVWIEANLSDSLLEVVKS